MSEERTAPTIPPYPVRLGSIPSADGVFPVDISSGGNRRHRRPMVDMTAHDIKAKAADQAKAEEMADGAVQAILTDEANPLKPYLEGIAAVALSIPATHLLKSAELLRGKEMADALDTPRPSLKKPLTPSEDQMKQDDAAFEAKGQEAVQDAKEGPSADPVVIDLLGAKTEAEFLAILAAKPDDDVKAILGNRWNGDEDTFAEAVAATWAAAGLKPIKYVIESTGETGTIPAPTPVELAATDAPKEDVQETPKETPALHTGGTVETPAVMPNVGEGGAITTEPPPAPKAATATVPDPPKPPKKNAAKKAAKTTDAPKDK